MTFPKRLLAIPALLVLALGTGCGSTVQGSLRAAASDGLVSPSAGADGLGGDALGGSPTTPGGGAGAPLSGPTSVPLSGSSPSSGRGGSTGDVAPGVALSGPGVTAKAVYVGLVHDVNGGAVNSAAGVGAITTGDDKANTRAIIADINKRGGVGGRTLVPVYANFDETSTQTLDQQYSAICQQFTHDNPPVYAVDVSGTIASFRDCLAKAGVVMLSDSLPTVGRAEFTRYPDLIEQGYPNVDRLAAYQVTPLVEQHYFTPWNAVTGQPAATGTVKVGILTYNDVTFSSAVDHFLVPALKRLGYDPQVAKIAQITTAADYGAQAAAVKSAQLSFAANGVTHVIPFESNGGLSTLFLPTARSQHYYPRYGVSSASGFEALIEAGVVAKQQMNGAVGFGWFPSIDLPAGDNPDNGPYANANARHCLKVMAANGITFTSGNAKGIAENSCANLYLLKTALDRTPTQITARTFLSVVESLGTSYQGAGNLGERFAPERHDPSDKAYHWRYFGDCGCFHYEGALETVP
jgi:hypothetical protein